MKYRSTLCLALLLSLPCAVARAEGTPSTADALFESGRTAMSKGDYATACARFAESHRIDPAPGTLLNLSLCEEKQGKLVAAHADLTEVLERLPKGDFRIAVAEKQLEALKKKLPSVTLTLDAESTGARVERDGIEVRADALARPILLDPGSHVFVVKADGRAGTRRDVALSEGDHVSFTLGAGPAVGGAASSTTHASTSSSRDPVATRRMLGIGALAVGGVGIVTGVVTGILTVSAASAYDEHCRGGTCDAEGKSAASTGETLEVVSPIAFGIGAIGAGVGTYLFLTSKRTTRAGLTVAPHVSSREAGFAIGGSF